MRRSQSYGRLAALLVLGAALVAPVRGDAQTQDVKPLRVCADPDDLPFSSSKTGPAGLYVELGNQIAQQLGRPFEPVWSLSYFGKHTVRTTLLAKTCDAYVGLPGIKGFMGPQLIYSKPFLHIGYAIVSLAGHPITSLDQLSGKRVAVQFSTPPQIMLADRDDIRTSTFLDPETAMQALVEKKVDAAFIWGPTAGYMNQADYHGAYEVTPVAGEGMRYPVKIGFLRADMDLRDQVDDVLDKSGDLVTNLVAKYGLPTAEPIKLASLQTSLTLASETETDGPKATPVTATALDDSSAEQGHKIFNGTCSHCHGPDAVQSVKKIDLRLLRHRYGDEAQTVFHDTVTHGRPSKGMPNWSAVFSEDDFTKIYAYLSTIQSEN